MALAAVPSGGLTECQFEARTNLSTAGVAKENISPVVSQAAAAAFLKQLLLLSQIMRVSGVFLRGARGSSRLLVILDNSCSTLICFNEVPDLLPW